MAYAINYAVVKFQRNLYKCARSDFYFLKTCWGWCNFAAFLLGRLVKNSVTKKKKTSQAFEKVFHLAGIIIPFQALLSDCTFRPPLPHQYYTKKSARSIVSLDERVSQDVLVLEPVYQLWNNEPLLLYACNLDLPWDLIRIWLVPQSMNA